MIIRSTLFNISFWAWTFVLGILGLPFACISPKMALHIAHLWAWGNLTMLRILCGITHEIRGSQYIPSHAALIASKHQSAWDTVIFWSLIKHPVYVLKRELIFIPIFGWHLLLLKSIYIDRKSGASALKNMLRGAKASTEKGATIIIFPEGTRSAVETKTVYHPGVAALYQHLKVSVVPVALNSGVYWSKNAFVKRPGKIIIEFLPPIIPGLKSREFMTQLESQIETKVAALIKEAT